MQIQYFFDKMKNFKNYFVHNNVNKILIKPIKAKLIMRFKYKIPQDKNNKSQTHSKQNNNINNNNPNTQGNTNLKIISNAYIQ